MKEKLICITTPTDRTYYKAVTLAKEFLDKEQNVVNQTGELPNGKIVEINVSSWTCKELKDGKLEGKLEVINLTDGSVSFSEEYKNGVLVRIHEKENIPVAETPKQEKAAPLYPGTTLKTSKGTHSFYINGKEVAEETLASNGTTLELLGNIPDGEVKEFDDKGRVITEAIYKNNKLNGPLVRYTPTGEILSKETYVDGFLHGPAEYITFNRDGSFRATCTYNNSRLEGERRLEQTDGRLRCQETYKNGRLVGERTTFYLNGNKESVSHYQNGKLDGVREFFFPSGQIWYRETYQGGRLEGERTSFFASGKKFLEEFYTEGLLEGTRNIYAENGELLTSEEYHWGSLVHNTERKPA